MTPTDFTPTTNVRRNPAVIPAAGITTSIAHGTLKSTRGYFDKAAPYLGNMPMWITTVERLDEYARTLDAMAYDVGMLKADHERTIAAKWTRIDARIATWEGPALALIAATEAQVAKWDADLHAAATPPAPIADRAVLEAAMANARADALMVLTAAKDADQETPHRLAEMARGDDPVLAYLVLATSWPQTFMRAHDLKTAPAMWQHERGKLLGGVLTDKALRAYERLPGLPDARKGATLFRAVHSFLVRQNDQYFRRPDGA